MHINGHGIWGREPLLWRHRKIQTWMRTACPAPFQQAKVDGTGLTHIMVCIHTKTLWGLLLSFPSFQRSIERRAAVAFPKQYVMVCVLCLGGCTHLPKSLCTEYGTMSKSQEEQRKLVKYEMGLIRLDGTKNPTNFSHCSDWRVCALQVTASFKVDSMLPWRKQGETYSQEQQHESPEDWDPEFGQERLKHLCLWMQRWWRGCVFP